VINYDVSQLIFHGALKYDDNGTVVGEVRDSARMLAGMIHQINENIQNNYTISKPKFLTVPRHQDFSKKKNHYFRKLKKLQREYNLNDNDTLGMYHQEFWREFIFNSAKQFRYKISMPILEGLTKRWAFSDKSYTIPMIKKSISNQKFLEWVLLYDKNDNSVQVKENMKPFEILFLEVGSEIMKNISGFLSINPDKSVQLIRKKINDSINFVKRGKDLKKLNRLKLQLEKLEAIGGLNAIVPTEGIVFKYKGNTYKFTGAFAPINQITGLMFF
jgi:hypothetical protein